MLYIMNIGARVQQEAGRLRGSRFARDVASVGLGIAAAQAISLLFSPLLTRLYGPEAFGVLGAYTAVLNIITPLATLGYANAVVIPAEDDRALAVARLSMASALVVAPLSLLAIYLFEAHVARWTGLEAAPGLLYLIPVALVLTALFSVASQGAIREGLFDAKSQAHVGATLGVNVAKLGGGVLAASGLMLIAIEVAGRGIHTLALLARAPRRGVLRVRGWFGLEGVWQAAWDHRGFSLYRMPQSIINAAALGLPVILLSSLFGSNEAGQYAITVLVLSAPVMLLGQSIGEVFYPKITRAAQTPGEDARGLIVKATLGLIAMGAVPFTVVALFGDRLFPIAFGDEWARAGEYAQWIALWMAASLASRASVQAMPALQIQHLLLVYEIGITISRVAALYVGAAVIGSDLAAVAVFSVTSALGMVVLIGLTWAKAGQADRQAT